MWKTSYVEGFLVTEAISRGVDDSYPLLSMIAQELMNVILLCCYSNKDLAVPCPSNNRKK